MLNKVTTLKGYRLHCLDGEIGRVKEFYFDDRHWTIRYLIADTGNWLTGRQVLVSPHALGDVNREEQHIAVQSSRKQIEDSPAVSTDKPVSRQFEETYYRYYGYPMYWGGPYLWGASYYPYIMRDAEQGQQSAQLGNPHGLGASTTAAPNAEASNGVAQDSNTWDSHLRSTRDVSAYGIQATDGEIGHVKDFVIDDETWAIRYLVIDTRDWWPGKKVLLSPQWIDRVSWSEKAVLVSLGRETIKQAPEYTDDALLSRDYESKLHDYYKRQGYWVDQPAVKPPR